MKRLHQLLREIDGKPYGSYKRLHGRHGSQGFAVVVDHVQGDAHGPPSRLHLHLSGVFHPNLARLETQDPLVRLAAEDLFLRAFARRLPAESHPTGDGHGGRLRTASPGPEIITRSASRLDKDGITLRFTYALPGEARRVMAGPADRFLADGLQALALDICQEVTPEKVEHLAAHLRTRRAVREAALSAGLSAFLPNGSVPARLADGRPVPGAVPLQVGEDLLTTLEVNGRTWKGLAIGQGVTVLAGGAFHGKTTLLEALLLASGDLGPADGLAFAVCEPSAQFVAVEEDRPARDLDLSDIFRRLPGGVDPKKFMSASCSGATSQASNLLESLGTGSRLLLVDEDASAANFLTRDPRIAELLGGTETVHPLASRCEDLRRIGASLVVVAGASSEWLALADRVIVLEEYKPHDATAQARDIVARHAIAPKPSPATEWPSLEDAPLNKAGVLELADVSFAKIRVQDGLVRFAAAGTARLPTRWANDERLHGAAAALCAYLRGSRDENRLATRKGLLEFLTRQQDVGSVFCGASGHEMAAPDARMVWGLWTRYQSA